MHIFPAGTVSLLEFTTSFVLFEIKISRIRDLLYANCTFPRERGLMKSPCCGRFSGVVLFS